MFIQTFNILFVIFYILHFSQIILIPNEIRYFMMISFLILNIYGLLKRKPFNFNRKSLDDDLLWIQILKSLNHQTLIWLSLCLT